MTAEVTSSPYKEDWGGVAEDVANAMGGFAENMREVARMLEKLAKEDDEREG